MGCQQVLENKGYRLTPQRLMVLEVIHNAEEHISVEEIYDQVRVRYPYVNISTIYRTLTLLKELRLAVETDFGEGRVRYHLAEKGHHHHLVCRSCGRVINLEESVFLSLEETLLRHYGFKADLKHWTIFGMCRECSK